MASVLLTMAVAVSIPSLLAQSGAGGGTIQGLVKDTSGAIIPGASVNILHVETQVANATVTNVDGFFSTPSLPIGRYQAKIAAPGMKTWEAELTLETGRIAEISPVLSPGPVNEVVTVTGSVPLVTTTDPTQGSTLDSLRIIQLPVNGRDLTTLIEVVTPGVDGGRANGMMAYSSDFVQDGADANQPEDGGAGVLQGLDSIGEVRVETSTSSARYNRPASVIVTTKGGGNQLHGSVLEVMRNNSLGVARARQDVNLSGEPYHTPRLIRNEFGGSMGGPVMLPSFGLNGKKFYDGRNRTFFFFNRENTELRQYATGKFAVPSMAWRNGDFGGLVDSQLRALTLYDPLTTAIQTVNGKQLAVRQPFTSNRIPVARQSPLSKFVYGITQLPNDVTNPAITTNLTMPVPDPILSSNTTTMRLDHRVNGNNSFFLKVSLGNLDQNSEPPAARWGPPTTNLYANTNYTQQNPIAGSMVFTHIFTPSLFVETLVSRTWSNFQGRTGATDVDWSAQLGLPNPFGDVGWPNLTGVGRAASGHYMSYEQHTEQRLVRDIVTNAEQNYTWIRGTHNISFGGRFRNDRRPFQPDQDAKSGDRAASGSANFTSLATSLMNPNSGSLTSAQAAPQTGYDAANFFLGYAATYSVSRKRTTMHVNERTYGLYLQDSYKVTDRLTVTPGLRWDINPAFSEDQHQINVFDLKSMSIELPKPLEYYYNQKLISPAVVASFQKVGVTFNSSEQLGKSSQIFTNNYFDIAPRAGFAYRLSRGSRQLVLRGGYGLYISPTPMRQMFGSFKTMPPFVTLYSYAPNNASTSPDGFPNYLLRTVPAIVAGLNSADAVDITNPVSVGVGQDVVGLGKLPDLRMHEWNLALEKQVSSSTVVRLTYAGKHGVNLDQMQNVNPAPPSYVWYTTTGQPLPTGTYASVGTRPFGNTPYADVQIYQKDGYQNTSTLAAEVQRRFSKGLAFQAFYTLTNSFRLGGNWSRDSAGSVPSAFLPGAVPTDPKVLNRFLNYSRDTAVPQHRVRWNWVYDLPVGRGKRFAGGVSRLLDAAVGGWRISGIGTVTSTWFDLPTTDWGTEGKLEIYGTKYKILDCRGTPSNATDASQQRCVPGYLWYNGYISQRYANAYNAAGIPIGVMGIPDNYQPAQQPVNPWPKGGKQGDPGSNYWDTDNVPITLQNGTVVNVSKDTNLHPWRNQSRMGPINWNQDASLLKYFTLTERLRLRANLDVFNVFNTQGLNIPTTEGIVSLGQSYDRFLPRQVQVALRLEW